MIGPGRQESCRQSIFRLNFCFSLPARSAFHGWPGHAMRQLGHNMQILGLAVLPLGILLELGHSIREGQMLAMMLAGVCLFGIGRIVEGYAR